MCGGVGLAFKRVPEALLSEYFSSSEIERFRDKGQIDFLYWAKTPLLPVAMNDQLTLMPWGNRDKTVALPQTGWAKQESLSRGIWRYYRPTEITIFGERGYEKGIWFDIKSGQLKGVIANDQSGHQAVYMLTKPASATYLELTGHHREPVYQAQ